MMRTVVSVFLMAISVAVNAQDSDLKDELKVGDRLPMSELKNMINYPSKTFKFADHKPKLTILDFWGTGCGGCVVAWPKMLALQKEFGKDLQIILVNRYEDEKTNKDFIAYRKKVVGVDMNLPVSCKDTTLRKYFPRRTVPRYYWIDSNGVVASLTHSDQVTSSHIRRWIETGPFHMDQIVEEIYRIDVNKPLFVDGNGGEGRSDAFIWSSSLTRGLRDVIGVARVSANPLTGYGICLTGMNIDGLYRTAYNNRMDSTQDFTYLPLSRRELNVSDTSKYLGLVNGERSVLARYNYQLIGDRPMNRQELQKLMQQDLQRYFGLVATWEKRRMPCLVMSMFDSTKAKSKTLGEYGPFIGETATYLDNVKVRDVIYYMEVGSFFYDRRPIIDETGFDGLLTGISFEAYYKDIKALDRGFSKFGMHIKEEIREVDILVLRDPESTN